MTRRELLAALPGMVLAPKVLSTMGVTELDVEVPFSEEIVGQAHPIALPDHRHEYFGGRTEFFLAG
jgi:hypothetical protein